MSFTKIEVALAAINENLDKNRAIRMKEPFAGIYIGGCALRMRGDPIPMIIEDSSTLNPDDGPVLVFSGCCGQYNEDDQFKIRMGASAVKWEFPMDRGFIWGAPDLCDFGGFHSHGSEIAAWLVSTGFAEYVNPL